MLDIASPSESVVRKWKIKSQQWPLRCEIVAQIFGIPGFPPFDRYTKPVAPFGIRHPPCFSKCGLRNSTTVFGSNAVLILVMVAKLVMSHQSNCDLGEARVQLVCRGSWACLNIPSFCVVDERRSVTGSDHPRLTPNPEVPGSTMPWWREYRRNAVAVAGPFNFKHTIRWIIPCEQINHNFLPSWPPREHCQ